MSEQELAKVIPLFRDATPPPQIPSAFWEWGEAFVTDGVNHLAYLVDSIENAEDEAELLDLIRQLKTEVASYPVE